MRAVRQLALTSLAIVQLTACATTLERDQEVIAVDSVPAGAQATIRCEGAVQVTALTPARLLIPRRADGCTLLMTKEGFREERIPLERGHNGAYWSNFALASLVPASLGVAFGGRSEWPAVLAIGLGGTAGFVIDRRNGRGYRHFPDEVQVRLSPR